MYSDFVTTASGLQFKDAKLGMGFARHGDRH